MPASMDSLHPISGPPTTGDEIPSVSYLDWYIPHVMSGYRYDLSHSGYSREWDWQQIARGELATNLDWYMGQGPDMRMAIAERESTLPEQVTLSHGVTPAMLHALLATLPNSRVCDSNPRNKRVLVETPSYAPVTQMPRLVGCETVEFERKYQPQLETPWVLDRNTLSELLPTASTLIITPALNPSGWMLSEEDQSWLAYKTREHNVTIISDEVYLDAYRGTKHHRPFHRYGDHCISINSLTKTYALPGLRFGWAISSELIAHQMKRVSSTLVGMVSAPAQRLAQIAWPHLDKVLEEMREKYKINAKRLVSLLEGHSIEWRIPPSGIFGVFRIPSLRGVVAIEELAEKRGLLLAPGAGFSKDMGDWVRVGWGGDNNLFNEAMVELDAWLTELAL